MKRTSPRSWQDAQLSSAGRRGFSLDSTGEAQPPGHAALALMVSMLGVPLFLMVGLTGTISLPTGPSLTERAGMISVPIGLASVAGIILGTATLQRSVKRSDTVAVLLIIFVYINVVAFIVGAMMNEATFISFAFLIQTFLPLLGYIAGRRIGYFSRPWADRAIMRLAGLSLLCLIGVALTTLASGGHPWTYVGDSLGPFAIPQSRRYLPTVVAFGLIVFARSSLARSVTVPKLALCVTATVLIASSHSRTGLVILAAAFVTFVFFDARVRTASRTIWAILGIMSVLLLWISIDTAESDELPVGVSRLVGTDNSAQLSSDRRAAAFTASLQESFSSPLGRMYRAGETTTLGGAATEYARISYAENQIGEYGLRAGPVAVLSVSGAIIVILLKSRRSLVRAKGESPACDGLWLATCSTLAVTVFTQQSLSQPYSGVLLWFALGFLRSRSD